MIGRVLLSGRLYATAFPILLAVTGLLAVLMYVGSYSRALDATCVGIAAALVAAFLELRFRVRRRRNARQPSRWPRGVRATTALAVSFLVSAWVILTAADRLTMSRALKRDWGAGAASDCPARVPGSQQVTGRRARVAVALSGGGYRAAILHAGVLAGLQCIGVQVDAISTVSGGSIIGAYYAIGGTPTSFRSMSAAGLFNLRRELLHIDNVLRLLTALRDRPASAGRDAIRFTQTDVQAALLDRLLFRGVRLGDVRSPPHPELLVNTTDLITGQRVALSPHGILTQFSHDPVSRQRYANPTGFIIANPTYAGFDDRLLEDWPSTEPLARVVAASGAFPGALRPVLGFAHNPLELDPHKGSWFALADGGLADNTGLGSVRDALGLAHERLRFEDCSARSPAGSRASTVPGCGWIRDVWGMSDWDLNPWLVDVIVMSDGSAMGKTALSRTALAELGRAADAMYRMSGPQLPAESDSDVASIPILLLSPRVFQREPDDSVEWTFMLDVRRVNVLTIDSLYAKQRRGGYQYVDLSALGVDLATVRFMIAHMIGVDRARALQVLRVAEGEEPINTQGRYGAITEAGALPTEADRELNNLLKAELGRRIAVFARTSTLRDQLDSDTIDSLYLLGQYLVLLNRPYLQFYAQRRP